MNKTELQKEIDGLVTSENVAMSNIDMYTKQLNDITKRKLTLESQITPPEIKVSDHAIVQYLERFTSFNVHKFKLMMISEVASSIINSGGSCKVTTEGSIRYVVQNYVIKTVTEP